VRTSFVLGVTNLSYSNLYSDLSLYASFAKTFELANNRDAAAGIRIRYESLSTTPDYPKLHFLFLDLGFSFDLTPEASIGATALNILGEKYETVSDETEKLERKFLIGIAYHPDALPLKLFTALEKTPIQPLNFDFGVEYDP